MNIEDEWLREILDEKQLALVTDAVRDPKVSSVIVAVAMVSGAAALLDEQGFTWDEIDELAAQAVDAARRKRTIGGR